MNIEPPIILFDGVCNFCNNTVIFILRQDHRQALRFAPLQSPAGQLLLQQYQLPLQDLDSFVFIDNGKAYLASNAALRLAAHFPWYWKWTQLFWIVPRFIRDGVYRYIAKNRYRWFGKKESCMIPLPQWRNRFLE